MDYYENQELACAVLGLDYNKIIDEGRDEEIDYKMAEVYEIDMSTFHSIAEALLRLTFPVKSELTGECYHAFGKMDGNLFTAIVKEKVTNKED